MEGRAINIAVFASGAGSNLRQLYTLGERGDLGPGHIVLLISDQPNCGAVQFATQVSLPVMAANHKSQGGRDLWEATMVAQLQAHGIDLVVLAGYMRIIGNTMLQSFQGRVINLHPSLLPAFQGLDAVKQAFYAQVAETGVTVHFVDEGLDSGPIIRQMRVPVAPQDSLEDLLHRVHEAEHRLLPQVVRELSEMMAKGQDIFQ